MFHVVVDPDVSAALGSFLGGNRLRIIAVLQRMRHSLENNADRWRGQRYPDDPDYFDYPLYLPENDYNWHTFRFSVNDRQAPGYLFVDSVSHTLGAV